MREAARLWKEANPEYQSEWWKANRDRARHYSSNRRDKTGSVETADIAIKVKKDICYWCGKKLNGKYHLDHVIPLHKGGKHIVANIVASCPHCNLSKGSKMPNEWISEGQLVLEMT